jgi:aminoglycoside phosphotransferase (APT) family kinase protein
MLDVDNAIPYLLAHGLIDEGWIVDGDLTIQCAAKRNRNLRIEGPGGSGYLIRQPDALAQASRCTLANEASFYEFCQEEPGAFPIAQFLPRMVSRDASRSVHVLELVPGALPLSWDHTAGAVQEFPVKASRALGTALGTVHRIFRRPELAESPRLAWLGRQVPWALSAHRPSLELLATLSPAQARMFRIIQETELEVHLARLGPRWQVETVIHGDIRSDNVLVPSRGISSEHAAAEIRIIDWEFVHIGDPAWDLAGALHDCLVFWTGSMPLEINLPAEEMAAQAQYPLDVPRVALRALWDGYRSASGLAPVEADELLLRAVAFSAARLIQVSYEISGELEVLPTQAVILLQISANLLADPMLGQTYLYGIPREQVT